MSKPVILQTGTIAQLMQDLKDAPELTDEEKAEQRKQIKPFLVQCGVPQSMLDEVLDMVDDG